MVSPAETDLTALAEAATRTGARPFKEATGNWATAVEVALMDTILSIGARADGAYGAGVLPRLRAYKAFRGQANMMRLIATLGPLDRKSTRLNSSHVATSYAVFCLKKKVGSGARQRKASGAQ